MSNAGRLAAIFGCEGLALSPDEHAFFRDCDPFGFILFARNIENPDQLVRLTSQLRDAVGRDAPILIDQEGGRVQRMRAPHWRDWSPPLDAAHAAGRRHQEARSVRDPWTCPDQRSSSSAGARTSRRSAHRGCARQAKCEALSSVPPLERISRGLRTRSLRR
jgi:hypothetical protein